MCCCRLFVDEQMIMDIKIQALMVYYSHWGNEQNKIRKTLHGIHSTMEMLNLFFHNGEENFDLKTEIKLLETWSNTSPYYVFDIIRNITDILLSGVGGCVSRPYIQSSIEWRLAQKTGVYIYDIYEIGMTDDDIRSVDAILALF